MRGWGAVPHDPSDTQGVSVVEGGSSSFFFFLRRGLGGRREGGKMQGEDAIMAPETDSGGGQKSVLIYST